jgi:hypothetical protein
MRYRSFAVAAALAVGLAASAAACGDSIDPAPADGPTTTEHDMSKMQPGETMPGGPTTTEHDMSKMQPGETMP